MRSVIAATVAALCLDTATAGAQAARSADRDTNRLRPSRMLMPIDFVHSAEFGWLQKPVHARRMLDDMTEPSRWKLSGTGELGFLPERHPGGMRALRVDVNTYTDSAPTRSGLSAVNLRRAFPNEDWRSYNRLSMWIRADYAGVPAIPLQIVMHNDGAEKVPDRYGREGHHYVTLEGDRWQQVVWEIEPLARDRVTLLEFGYFLNKMIADPGDHVAFEIADLELQRVDPDHHTGWSVAPGEISFSHSGYQSGTSKSAIVSDTSIREFQLVRVTDNAFGEIALRRPVSTVRSPKGTFRELGFSEIDQPGSYVLRAGNLTTKPFAIGADVWKSSILKTLNFYYGNRCGFNVPGIHGVDHQDWFATHGGQRLTMSGGWHDAGDLSQGVINTGEGAYQMFALAGMLMRRGDDPELVTRLLEEAKWGLEWVLRVRFDGGYRIGFGSHNYWTNNKPGDADDRSVAAKNNPNANYIAAAAAAIAYNVLKDREPELAARSLRIAEDDWKHAIVGVEGPSTWHTPAFAASRMELAGIGITASLELYRATGKQQYADKAVELAHVVMESQQTSRVGSRYPLSGFFYTGPDRDTLFHQFHRAADQAPIVALSQLVEALPDHPDWMRWYASVVRYAEYQKRTAETTAPYGVLPAYVYRPADSVSAEIMGARYSGTKAAFAEQARAGMDMGEGWYLRAFPVWYSRRGNYGVLLSQAKALSAASRLRRDSAGLDLAHRQAQWIVGRNPFIQSTMYGEGYDWAQQYSVSSGDFVGSLPVGMQSRGMTDLPYWPSANMYVYKEVWMHPSGRWLWLMEDLLPGAAQDPTEPSVMRLTSTTAANGEVTLRLVVTGAGRRTYTLRSDNLRVANPTRTATVRPGQSVSIEWKGRRIGAAEPWVAVAVEQGSPGRRVDAYGP